MSNPPALASRFDWYAATLEISPHQLLDGLRGGLGAEVREMKRGMHGYRQGFELLRDGCVVARALAGGTNVHPHAFASGEDAVEFARIVRANWPDHRVTRMDTAVDFDGAGDWERVTALALELADELGLKVGHAGDWHRGEDGRTLYIGSRKSAVFLRIYEKGKQLPESGRPNWVRCEVVVRPEGDSRLAAAASTATAAWGYAAWTQEFARRLLGVDVERVAISLRRPADDEKAMETVMEQYWRVFERQAGVHGGWEGLGRELGRLHREMRMR